MKGKVLKGKGEEKIHAAQCASLIDALRCAPYANDITRLKQRVAEADAGQFAPEEEMEKFFLTYSEPD